MKQSIAALAFAATAALATTLSAQTIQACHVAKTGTVYRVNVADAPITCGKNPAFTWNATGPAGQAGPQGPAGAGTTFHVHAPPQFEASTPLGGGAECFEGDVAVGGGYDIVSDDPSVQVTMSKPEIIFMHTVPTRWGVVIANPNGTTFKVSFYVVCARPATP